MVEGTKVRSLPFNSTVEIVLQNPLAVPAENHPIHLHGFNFFVLAQGLGTFTPGNTSAYNLVDPVARNTIAVPTGGWVVIRFLANNPGMWFFHCHLDAHVPMGLGMVFAVENGTTPGSMLPPPPDDLPMCKPGPKRRHQEPPPPPPSPEAKVPHLSPPERPEAAEDPARGGATRSGGDEGQRRSVLYLYLLLLGLGLFSFG